MLNMIIVIKNQNINFTRMLVLSIKINCFIKIICFDSNNKFGSVILNKNTTDPTIKNSNKPETCLREVLE